MESDVYACFYKYASLLSVLKNKIPKYCKKQIKNEKLYYLLNFLNL